MNSLILYRGYYRTYSQIALTLIWGQSGGIWGNSVWFDLFYVEWIGCNPEFMRKLLWMRYHPAICWYIRYKLWQICFNFIMFYHSNHSYCYLLCHWVWRLILKWECESVRYYSTCYFNVNLTSVFIMWFCD